MMPVQEKEKTTVSRRKIAIITVSVCLVLFAGWLVLCRPFQAAPEPQPLAGYVAAADLCAPVYDAEGTQIDELPRGTAVSYLPGEPEDELLCLAGEERYLRRENLTDTPENAVLPGVMYVRSPNNLTDAAGVRLGNLVERGAEVNVTGYQGMHPDGSVERYRVTVSGEEGYIRAEYLAAQQIEDEIPAVHAGRGNRWGGGSAGELDYTPRAKADFSSLGNSMPEEVKALYINSESIAQVEDYVELAQGSGVNAFVVDIVDGGAVAYPAQAMREYCPTACQSACNSAEVYRDAVERLREAGYYVIGRITVFNDPCLAEDHPECVIADRNGDPMEIGGMYWPSVYSRFVWQYKVDLAVEAAQDMGFHEIQFDYMRFPDGTWEYEDDEIDYRNSYGESKAQAVQRFLMYACDRLHEAGVYVAADVFGECAESYVTAYGQYWPAISNVADVICAMPYPDHYGASGDYLPWEHPYDTLYAFGTKAAARQRETPSPAVVRTWVQAYDAIREPYNSYGAGEVARQAQALRDSGNTGGFMTWNAASSRSKYRSLLPAFG